MLEGTIEKLMETILDLLLKQVVVAIPNHELESNCSFLRKIGSGIEIDNETDSNFEIQKT